jgi:hypothetical protein
VGELGLEEEVAGQTAVETRSVTGDGAGRGTLTDTG